jgi:hypothetical protein
MSEVNVNLDGTTTVNYKGLREGNAFGFNFTISIGETPIDASLYAFTLTVYSKRRTVLVVEDDEWAKDEATITKLFDAFPLEPNTYTFDLTWVDGSDNVVTLIPGTIEVIRKDA